MIKLYSKTCLLFKAKNIDEINESLEIIKKDSIPLPDIQAIEIKYFVTNRKNNPLDVEIKYYDIETIIDMVNDLSEVRSYNSI